MKITKKGEYALKTLLNLATAHGEVPVSLREIAAKERLSVKFLEQIMMSLKRAGFVESTKGQHGGYVLGRLAKEITLGEVVRTVDGPLAPMLTGAKIEKQIRTEKNHAGLYSVLFEVRNAVANILDKTTLSDVLERSNELALSARSDPMYYI